MSLTISSLNACASAQNTNEGNKEIQQKKSGEGKFVGITASSVLLQPITCTLHKPKFFSTDASFLDCVKEICEIAYRALTSLIYAPFHLLSLIYQGRGTMFDFRLGEMTPKRLEEVGTKYGCGSDAATFLIYVDETMNSIDRVMVREDMSPFTFKGVFNFGDSKEIYISGSKTRREEILKKALEYYNSQSSYIPFYSPKRTFIVQYAGYTSPLLGWIKSLSGNFGVIFKGESVSLAYDDKSVSPNYSYHLRTSNARERFNVLDKIPAPKVKV